MKILTYPNIALTTPTERWDFRREDSYDRLLEISKDMDQALKSAKNGAALAANQVGLPYRLFLIERKQAIRINIHRTIVNPEVVPLLSGTDVMPEGCLSFPGTFVPVQRNSVIMLAYYDIKGQPHSIKLQGFPARIVQHEVEHLDGKIFLDNVPRIKRDRLMNDQLKD